MLPVNSNSPEIHPMDVSGSEQHSDQSLTDDASWGDLGPPEPENCITPDPPEPRSGVDSTLESFNLENGEALLVQELNNLTMEERERILHDVHGVEEEEESPEQVETALQQLDTSIEVMKRCTNPDAYILAESMSPAFVRNDAFRLLFLRALRFDVDKATVRIFAHFEKKLELFGADKLCKKITLDDLSEDDMTTLKNGQTQLLPDRDRSGRAIFFQAHSHMVFREHANVLRTLYYIQMTALEDEETQKKGFVVVVYNVEPQGPQSMDAALFLKIYDLLPTLPTKFKGIHYCVKHTHVRKFLSSIRARLRTQDDRQRTRVHSGSHQECQYCLMTFGVPTRHFPISNYGELNRDRHLDFIETVRKQEQNVRICPTYPRIVVPAHRDVLLGRGRPFQLHLANMRLSQTVTSLLPVYEKSSKQEKTAIAKKIVEEVKNGGGRFLKQNAGVWEEVTDQVALNKISHSFRTHRSMSKLQAKDGTDSLSDASSKDTSHERSKAPYGTATVKRSRAKV